MLAAGECRMQAKNERGMTNDEHKNSGQKLSRVGNWQELVDMLF